MHLLKNTLTPVYHLLFPNLCNGCGNELLSNEATICTTCISTLPLTKFHLIINNPFEQKLAGRVNIEHATAMYYFNKGGVIQELLHGLKYQQKQAIGALLGMYFAKQLLDVRWIADIDIVIPIPLSKQKMKMRGFNQSTCIGESFAAHLNKPLDTTSVVRLKNTASQTHKTRVERMDNVKDAFMVTSPNSLQHKHIMLIDDVVTTGATLEECAQAILKIDGTKVSIVTLAYAIE